MRREETGLSEPLEALIRRLKEAQGIDLSSYDESFLSGVIDKRRASLGPQTLWEYGEALAVNREEAGSLVRSLRITYSEFFRSSLVFALLEHLVLPSLITAKTASGRGEIRVWSAGCAAGQEAWSVAMLLDEMLERGASPLSYRIFATDVSEPELALARAGVYSTDAAGNVRLRHLRSCCSGTAETFAMVPRLRDRVDFSVYDLLDERSSCPAASIYGDFDLIFCSNVLFYYRASCRQRFLDKFCGALSAGGYFVTGEAERDLVAQRKELRSVAPPAAVFQKKVNP